VWLLVSVIPKAMANDGFIRKEKNASLDATGMSPSAQGALTVSIESS